MDARVEKNFIRINVSDPRDHLLVEQNRFHRATMFSEDLSEFREADVERIRTEATFPQVFIYVRDQPDLAEFALILECKAVGIGENKEHSRMPARRSLGRGWSRRLLLIFGITQRAGHAEMQSQPEISIGAHKQMFAVAAAGFEA